MIAPNTANANRAIRQPNQPDSNPPSGAETQAITPRPVSPLDITRVPSTGLYKSRSSARAHTTPAPMAMPWTVRQKISASMLGTMAHTMEDSTYSPMPTSKMGRRPNRSDKGPQTSCDRPNASSSAVNVN